MSTGEVIAPFFGRVILAWFFISEAARYAGDWDGTVDLLTHKHVPVPSVFIILSLILVVLSALSLITGLRTKLGALVLFLYTIMIALVIHDYWTIADEATRAADYAMFSRDIAIAGGLLVILGIGPGRFAVENIKARGGRR